MRTSALTATISEHTMIPARRFARSLRLGLAAAALAALVAGCGGGSSQYEPFAPDRYIAFGDEASAILSDGRRYTVNPLKADGSIDCSTEPLWTQTLAKQYGFVFRECNPDGATTFKAEARAVPGAQADDLKRQIDEAVAAGSISGKVLATVMLGTNDVLALYATYPAQSEAQLTAELRSRGERLAQQVNRLVDLGARVIVSTAADVGMSPYAAAEKAAHTDTDRAALLQRLVSAFNSGVRVNILNDGRFVGLVLGDEAVQAMAKFPAVYGLVNSAEKVCTVALPDCTSGTLVTDGKSSTWLWADDRRLAYGGQNRLGSLALARALGNPF